MRFRLVIVLKCTEYKVLAEAPGVDFIFVFDHRICILTGRSDLCDFLLEDGRILALRQFQLPQEMIDGGPIEVSDVFQVVFLFGLINRFFLRFLRNLRLVRHGRLGSRRLLLLHLGRLLGLFLCFRLPVLLVEVAAAHLALVVASKAVNGAFFGYSYGVVLTADDVGYVIAFIWIELLDTRRVRNVDPRAQSQLSVVVQAPGVDLLLVVPVETVLLADKYVLGFFGADRLDLHRQILLRVTASADAPDLA